MARTDSCRSEPAFIHYDNDQYLVTAQHVAVGIGEMPFGIRTNLQDGGAETFIADPATDEIKWFCKDDSDIAVLPFGLDDDSQIHRSGMLSLPDFMLVGEPGRKRVIEVGDMTYTIGLFRMVAGMRRNVPVVHCGNIALMAGEEPVPVRDWLQPENKRARRTVKAFLVEQQSLQGLSGAPVFIRHPTSLGPLKMVESSHTHHGLIPMPYFTLLGIWQGAWDAPPDDVLGVDFGKDMRVPVVWAL